MNHRPFEDWLLEDEYLTVQQQRELQIHLRSCTTCAALASSNLALHSKHLAAPDQGFAERFRPRLAAWKREQLKRQAIGTVILVLAGLGLLYALAGPLMIQAVRSPATWLSQATSYVVELLTVASIFEQVGGILFRSFTGLIPASAWGAIVAGSGLFALFWIFTMRRLSRAPQGA
jgi:hypothetical protein